MRLRINALDLTTRRRTPRQAMSMVVTSTTDSSSRFPLMSTKTHVDWAASSSKRSLYSKQSKCSNRMCGYRSRASSTSAKLISMPTARCAELSKGGKGERRRRRRKKGNQRNRPWKSKPKSLSRHRYRSIEASYPTALGHDVGAYAARRADFQCSVVLRSSQVWACAKSRHVYECSCRVPILRAFFPPLSPSLSHLSYRDG